jgi:peptidoglycan/LPS O-acetylase OafA/YrhL
LNGAWRIVASLLCIGQVWSLDVNPPLNAPFWSLNFEIWYYALFGAWAFLDGQRRAITIAAIAVAAGPKIWFLLPVWLLGVALYWRRAQLCERTALAMLLVTSALAVAFIQLDVSVAIRSRMIVLWPAAMAGLHGANQFVGDWLLALVIAANFTAAASLGRFGAPLLACARPIKAIAGYTFSAYLYHMPLLALAVIAFNLKSWSALLAVGIGVAVLAQVSERQLPTARRILRWIVTPRAIARTGEA